MDDINTVKMLGKSNYFKKGDYYINEGKVYN